MGTSSGVGKSFNDFHWEALKLAWRPRPRPGRPAIGGAAFVSLLLRRCQALIGLGGRGGASGAGRLGRGLEPACAGKGPSDARPRCPGLPGFSGGSCGVPSSAPSVRAPRGETPRVFLTRRARAPAGFYRCRPVTGGAKITQIHPRGGPCVPGRQSGF